MSENLSNAIAEARIAVDELKQSSNGTVQERVILALARLNEALLSEATEPDAPETPAPGQPS